LTISLIIAASLLPVLLFAVTVPCVSVARCPSSVRSGVFSGPMVCCGFGQTRLRASHLPRPVFAPPSTPSIRSLRKTVVLNKATVLRNAAIAKKYIVKKNKKTKKN
jgi:hypothetical protein